jgi:2,3-bisphosphoglycerate-independent phosphoglycerate mutase
MDKVKQKCCLVVIDGWGISEISSAEGDAVRNANTPVMDALHKEFPSHPLAAHGLSVGLPDGLMGNSEVGHLNIGAGRVVYQDIVRIELAIRDDKLKSQENVLYAFNRAKSTGRLHLMGLVSDGGVHSHMDHLFYLIKAAKDFGIPETFIHFFADGRDTAPKSAMSFMEKLLKLLNEEQYGKLATVVGRYYAMDRDKRWERIKVAYEALVQGKGEETQDVMATLAARYQADETDEFLKPIIANSEGIIRDSETVICFNFRSDRMREITLAMGIELPFETEVVPKNVELITMTSYKFDYPFKNIFPAQTMDNVLAEWLGRLEIPQSHIAETEKYAHVTFFFNGGIIYLTKVRKIRTSWRTANSFHLQRWPPMI